MRTAPGPTPLQVAQLELHAVLAAARDKLDERTYCALIRFACALVAAEAARCAAWEDRRR
jgi:hypothetical protein